MTQQEMYLLVPRKLREIEEECGVRVLYAAEAGSRACGTNSEASDFDVRFIYIRSRAEYLRLDQTRDVMDFPIEDGWDMFGWDLTKTLQLLHSSNTQIFDWFHSGVVYLDDGFSRRFRPVLDTYFSPKTAAYHYLNQAEQKFKKVQKTDTPKVKRYLYALQYLVAARWVLDHQAPAPVDFKTLNALLPDEIRCRAEELLVQKTSRPDLPRTDRDSALESWLEAENMDVRRRIGQLPKETTREWDLLNRFFLEELERNM